MLVSDKAGNQAKARTIIFVDPHNTIQLSRDATVAVNPGVTRGNRLYVETYGDISLDWSGVFSNDHHVSSHYLAEVEEMRGAFDDVRANEGR